MSARVRKAMPQAPRAEIDRFRAQHLNLAQRQRDTPFGRSNVTVDEGESPLAWLARRRDRAGRALIAPHQLQAGERLRTDFTQAHLMPRTTADLSNPLASGRKSGAHGPAHFTDLMVTARQRLHAALDDVGPEFSGLLMDVCCFLKGLEDSERERGWPARSAKLVLQLGLDRLARHYGYAAETRGRARAEVRTWLAAGAQFTVD